MTRRTLFFVLLILGAAAALACLLSKGDAGGFPRVHDSSAAAPRIAPEPPPADSRPLAASPAIAGRPFQQSNPPDASEAPAEDELVLTVVDDDDKPIEGAFILSNFEPDFETQSRHLFDLTESDGTARIALWKEKTDLVVMARGHKPVLAPISDRARMRVTLHGEIALRGHVRVDGAPLRKPMRIVVLGYDDPTDAWPERFKDIEWLGFGNGRLPFETDETGAFVVRGPTPGSTVGIEIPDAYAFQHTAANGNLRETTVLCGTEPVVIDVVTRTALSGTIVSHCHEIGFPAHEYADWEIRYLLERVDAQPAMRGTTSTRSGRFSIPFTPQSLRVAVIEAWYNNRRYFTKTIEDIAGSRDIGTLVIDCPPTLHFRLLDGSGQPIRGGRVLAEGHLSERSDDAGRTKLGVFPWMTCVVVGAPGFQFKSIKVPELRADAFDVVLEPAITLLISVRGANPAVPLTGTLVTVDYRGDAATKAVDANWLSCDDFRITESWDSPAPAGWQRRVFKAQANAPMPFGGFRGGDDVRVLVWDSFGHKLASQDLHLTQERVQSLDLVLRARPRTIRGAVLDPDGRPIPGSKAAIGRLLPKWAPDTDSSGNFEFHDVCGDAVVVSAVAPGYIAKTVDVPPGNDPVTVRLERGRSLTVDIAPSDRAFEGQVRFESENGLAWIAERRAACVYFFDTISCRAGRVVARSADSREASVAAGPADTRVRLQPPE